MDFPLAIKIISPNIIHKSDGDGVKIGLDNKGQGEKSYDVMIKKVKKAAKRKVEGNLVQKMEQGIEVIIGMKNDLQFGPVLLFGLGGIFVEIMKDTSLRLTPVDKNQAIEMIKKIKSSKILEGARGQKPANINTIADIIVKTSNLVEKNKQIKELDFNPVIVNEKTATIVDVRIMVD